ncbi:cysteine hydrolase [Bosea vestrisii]|uniref:cysteine hydrolase family protein n=1 Tax=Bosea vestrisii TaxID=151416 RepID=UPI0024E0308E|nr:cysteine hydrolase [Bosea vestrisii]WID99287.1 cysteine hydrolase [Bosea vestrisii]
MHHALTPLTLRAVHICINMQRVFSDEGLWSTPWLPNVLPQCVALAKHRPDATIFTRFVTPPTPETAKRRLESILSPLARDDTRASILPCWSSFPNLRASHLPLRSLTSPSIVRSRAASLVAHLRERDVETVILTGAETDVCVLSSALGAVDHGFHVIVAKDAVCSFSDTGHDALLSLFEQRFSQQITVLETAQILEEWRT